MVETSDGMNKTHCITFDYLFVLNVVFLTCHEMVYISPERDYNCQRWTLLFSCHA